jgi:hypothetical protein
MLKAFCQFTFLKSMIDQPDVPHWPSLMRPLAEASFALGGLSHGLAATSLHAAWLWREMARSTVKICQMSGYRVQHDRLMLHLAGLPHAPGENAAGLSAARRLFLTTAPLFRQADRADSGGSLQELFLPLWQEDEAAHDGSARPDGEGGAVSEERDGLAALADRLADGAVTDGVPALLAIPAGLRHAAASRRLPPGLTRLALPLALQRAGLLSKAAPALIGGRLPLGATRAQSDGLPVTAWLVRCLSALAAEAKAASRRLDALFRQHRAWQERLATAGLRRHARAPLVLDLLTATPVVSASLAARHLDCSSAGAGEILRRLADLGIVREATARARWKIYLATDLVPVDRRRPEATSAIAPSLPLPTLDPDLLGTTLDRLLADLERVQARSRALLGEAGEA